MKKFAVVILNWNGAELLKTFLPSVVAHSEQAHIYVADNYSTDDSLAVLSEAFPEVTLIRNPKNFGFAGGYNHALKQVHEPYYVLVNSDIEVTENWLNPVEHLFDSHSEIAIVQPKIRDYKRKDYFEYAGAAGGFMDKFGYPYCRGRLFDTIEKDTNQYEASTALQWASGACFFIRKTVYHELGGFDEDFFAHQEEIDLCWRTRNNGFIIAYEPNSLVFHVGGATLQQGNPKKTFLNFRNSLYMLTKNLPKNKLFPIIFMRLILDGIAGIQFLFSGKWQHCWAILKAHFAYYGNLRKMINKRDSHQLTAYYHKKSILWQYFVQNGKVFEE